MKSKVISLTKVILKNSFQNVKPDKTTNKKSIGMIILYAFVFLYLAGIIGVFSNGLIKELMGINQEQMFLGLILLVVAGFVLIQSVFSAINVLYYSKDNEYILPLPIKPRQIVASKTNVLLITEYFIVVIIGLLPLTIYGILTSANILYYISMLIVLVIFPIIPVLISSLLTLIIMSFSKFTKNKNRFQLFATLFLIVIIFFVSFSTSNTETTPEQMVQVIIKANGMVDTIRNAFPTLGMAIDSLTNTSLENQIINIILLIAITAIIYVIYIAVGQRLYLKGAVGNLASGKKTKKKLNEKKAFKKRLISKTYIGKEFKILFRNPIYFMQCILPAIIFPILIIGITFLGIKGEENGVEVDIVYMITNKSSIYLGVGILCIIQFFLMFVFIAVTAISRDGQNAMFMKYIPVSLMKQIDYKVFPNIVMTTFMSLITIGIVEYLLRLPIIYLLLITIAAIIMGILQSYVSIIVDLKKPKLKWSSEFAVVKQNMNLFWTLLFELLNITVLLVLTVVLKGVIDSYIFIAIITIVYVILTIFTRNYIKNNINKLFQKIY